MSEKPIQFTQESGGERFHWLYGALTLAVMVTIFWFSAQPAEESAGLSNRFLEWILSGQVPVLSWFANATGIFAWLSIRKCAHAFVYFTLGICASLTAKPRAADVALAWGFCFLYACSDELHQYFVPGRSCEWRDVALDTAGALVGVLLVLLIRRVRRRRKENGGR